METLGCHPPHFLTLHLRTMFLHNILDETDNAQRWIKCIHRSLRNIGNFLTENAGTQLLLVQLHDVRAIDPD
ncbi:hypothetical protein D3C76_1392930 [compost metagenome]